MQRAMAAEAEATRDSNAKVISAEGEQKASLALKEAADVINQSPIALQLRYLQTLTTVATEKNSTIIFPIPLEMLSHFSKEKVQKKQIDTRENSRIISSSRRESSPKRVIYSSPTRIPTASYSYRLAELPNETSNKAHTMHTAIRIPDTINDSQTKTLINQPFQTIREKDSSPLNSSPFQTVRETFESANDIKQHRY